MTFLQDLGNHGSHHQEGETEPVSHDSVEIAISRIEAICDGILKLPKSKFRTKFCRNPNHCDNFKPKGKKKPKLKT